MEMKGFSRFTQLWFLTLAVIAPLSNVSAASPSSNQPSTTMKPGTNYTLIRFILHDPLNNSHVCILMETSLNITIHYNASDNVFHAVNFTLSQDNVLVQDAAIPPVMVNLPAQLANASLSKVNPVAGTVAPVTKILPVVPDTSKSGSYCGENTQRMCVWIWPPAPAHLQKSHNRMWSHWELCMEFTRELDVQEDPNQGWSSVGAPPGGISGAYHLRNVTFMYHPDHPIFQPRPANSVSEIHSISTNRFASRVNDYYVCMHGATLKITPRIELGFARIKVQSFSNKGTVEFTGSTVVCEDDLESDHTVGYIFLGVIGLLLVVVLIGFVLGRQREGKARQSTSNTGYTHCQTHQRTPY